MKRDNGLTNFLLYADDDADDRLLLTETFSHIAPGIDVITVPSGYATLEFLQNQTPPLPCLLILDLNMPGMNGKEVIEQLKKDEHYQKLPIVVFTTSANPSDREECARYGVDLITKPLDLKDLEQTVFQMLQYCK